MNDHEILKMVLDKILFKENIIIDQTIIHQEINKSINYGIVTENPKVKGTLEEQQTEELMKRIVSQEVSRPHSTAVKQYSK
ncbi:MAG: hypothetical protein KKA84_15935 [Bacteroidetes bacterium]|nr:hypothetical protein [Bacteroidota bacterium]